MAKEGPYMKMVSKINVSVAEILFYLYSIAGHTLKKKLQHGEGVCL